MPLWKPRCLASASQELQALMAPGYPLLKLPLRLRSLLGVWSPFGTSCPLGKKMPIVLFSVFEEISPLPELGPTASSACPSPWAQSSLSPHINLDMLHAQPPGPKFSLSLRAFAIKSHPLGEFYFILIFIVWGLGFSLLSGVCVFLCVWPLVSKDAAALPRPETFHLPFQKVLCFEGFCWFYFSLFQFKSF